jgi:hypothetical protein
MHNQCNHLHTTSTDALGPHCADCGEPLVSMFSHIREGSNSDRISNLGLACACCNQKKGNLDVRDFVKDPKRLARILAQAKTPLKDAAAVNSTRWVLFNTLKETGLPVATGTGGQTKFNRTRLGIAKGHALDAGHWKHCIALW